LGFAVADARGSPFDVYRVAANKWTRYGDDVTSHSKLYYCLPLALLLLAPSALSAQTATAQSYVWVGPREFPTVDFGRLNPGDAVPGQPGKVFQHKFLPTGGGGWYVADSGGTTPVSQVLSTAPESSEPPAPPAQDEWGSTDAYTGVGANVPVLLRTANQERWFCKGCNYIGPYSEFRMTILDRVQLTDGNWAWLGQITQSGGSPARGTILSFPLYGDRGMWMTEDEFAAAVQANLGR
jgi:hypothetical protein